jgi:hypothetical protein
MEGAIWGTPGIDLRIHDGTRLSVVSLDRVQEIRFAPEKEAMEQKWRFVEAGRTEKQKWGEPYPVRFVRATVLLGGGQTMSGHLYTSVLYVEQTNRTQKVVLDFKQRGKEGQRLEDLVYPVRVEFADKAGEVAGNIRVALGASYAGGEVEVAALTGNALVRLEGRRQENGDFLLPPAFGERIFLGVRTPALIAAGWPSGGDTQTAVRVSEAMKNAQDFFDERQLLGVQRDSSEGNIYSLVMLSRKGATTLGGERTQPWRLVVWRWREDEGGRLMLAGVGYLFRGIMARGERPPEVELSPAMWQAASGTNGVIVVGQ